MGHPANQLTLLNVGGPKVLRHGTSSYCTAEYGEKVLLRQRHALKALPAWHHVPASFNTVEVGIGWML